MSALQGDNVVERTEAMPWYDGPDACSSISRRSSSPADRNLEDRRFPVQWVIRPMSDEHHDYRGYAGEVAGGIWQAGDEVVVLPSGRRSRVAAVENFEGPLEAAIAPQSVTIRLEDDIDVGRGDMLADPDRAADRRARAHRRALLDDREAARAPRALRGQAHDAIAHEPSSRRSSRPSTCTPSRTSRRPAGMELNDLGVVKLRLAEPLAVDPYERNRATGAFILIDEATNDTVAAGMVIDAS